MQAVRYTRHARGGRVYILGYRLHHGTVGVAAIIAGVALHRKAFGAAALVVGGILCAHDWPDHRLWWFRDGG